MMLGLLQMAENVLGIQVFRRKKMHSKEKAKELVWMKYTVCRRELKMLGHRVDCGEGMTYDQYKPIFEKYKKKWEKWKGEQSE